MRGRGLLLLALVITLTSGCGGTPAAMPAGRAPLSVLAAESFLADIAQNVAGSRLTVDALLPAGVDPHGFEPVPADVARLARSEVLIINGAGLEEFLGRMIANAGGQREIIEASAGLKKRAQQQGESSSGNEEGDPHFWLDPNNVVSYVQNIRDGLTRADPAGAATYAANADAYIAKLRELDTWVREQVSLVPQQNRLLATNHESLGYFADRYGFTVVGTILASVSTSASPSAQELVLLVQRIRETGARALFVETGTNPQLARQVAQETGVKVVTDLYTHSTSRAGPAPTYIDMMKYNVTAIVSALK